MSSHMEDVEIGHDDLCHPDSRRAPFTAEGWSFELKHDGFPVLARRFGGRIQLLSRWGSSLSHAFPEIVAGLDCQSGAFVLDGELVVPDAEGRSDFDELRRRALLQNPRRIELAALRTPAVLVVFDLLYLDGANLRSRSLTERRARLSEHVESGRAIQLIESIPTYGEALFATIVEHDHEGVVGKRLDAPYRGGRQSSWVKIKNQKYSRREAFEWHDRR